MLIFNTSYFCANFISFGLYQFVIIIVIALSTIVIAYFKWSYQYWQRKKVPYLEPTIPFGNFGSVFSGKEAVPENFKRCYDEIKARGWKHGGIYVLLRPYYLVVDLDYVKNIMTKDFQYFVDRGFFYNEEDDPLSAHLFAIGGEKWRNLRIKLSPTFTSGKMKMMYQTLVDCVPYLLEKVEVDRVNTEAIDIKEILGRFTADVIGSCAFSVDCNASKDANSPFIENAQKFFDTSITRIFKFFFGMNFPNLAKTLHITLTPKDISDFFIQTVKKTVEYREQNNVICKDFLQLLINLKNNKLVDEESYKHDGKALTIEEVAAQSFVFFLAGHETSSTTMTFALYELARNQEIQDKVREEINTILAKHDGKMTYDAIQYLKYMDQVINETLRMYPPGAYIDRLCVKNYKVPDQDVIIEKGTRVLISVLGIHRDKEYYPDPEKFDPERFSEDNKAERHHYAHIPFGEGPRICIGMRFELMQSKVGMTTLLKNYKFTVNKKTIEPLKFKVQAIIPAAEGEIWLDAEKI